MSATTFIPNRPTLQERLEQVGTCCTECGNCLPECAFLRKHGTPKSIAEGFDGGDRADLSRSFECSLCGLC
ncbi:MAG: 4Fe-4S dicluster domain-containing protein, partial [Deltaproteobacteria bacterium]